ncbi:hypothetical protein Dimus_039376 [Dionaea muscipula]
MVRSILKSKNLPLELWAEAAACFVYTLNRAPTKSLVGKTPQGAWYGRKPYVGHLKVFGSVVYAQVPAVEKQKLDDRSKKFIFIGYDGYSKGYKLLDPANGGVIFSRDCYFEEDNSWDWRGKSCVEGLSSVTLSWDSKFPDLGDADFQEDPDIDQVVGGNGSIQYLQQETGAGSGSFSVHPAAASSPAAASASAESSSPTSVTAAPIVPSSAAVLPDSNEFASDDSSSSASHPRMRTLQEIYEVTENENDVSLFCLLAECEPFGFQEAVEDKAWSQAMDDEISAINRNNTWQLVDLPMGCKAIGVKWVYKLKKDVEGNVVKHKARLVVKGYNQQPGIDFNEVFAPVARLETVRLLLTMAARLQWEVFQMDFKSAFLNGVLKEDVYIQQPPSYAVKGREHQVLKLHKALYGLKQAPRTWNITLDSFLRDIGFSRCPHEYALYVKHNSGCVMILCVYVDDILITGNAANQIEDFKKTLIQKFEMTDLGKMSYYLGIKVEQSSDGVFLSQHSYIKKVLE